MKVKNLDFTQIEKKLDVISLNGVRIDAEGKEVDLHESVKSRLASIKGAEGDPGKAIALMKRAHDGDQEAKVALNALRSEQINNFIYPSLNFGSLFFRIVELGDADRPVIQNETKQQINVGYMGEDGEPVLIKAVNPQAETLIPLKTLATEKFGYRLRDIYNGNIAASAQRNVDIAFDMANQVDALAFALLTAALGSGGAFGAFTLTGNKVSRVYVPNTRIDTSNLPSTNDIQAPNSNGSSKFRLEALRSLIGYCDQWANSFSDGPLRPTGRIVVPSQDAVQLADEIVPTGSTNNSTADQLMNNYTSFDYLGVRWTIIPDNTLPAKKFYAQLTKPVGTIYTKPSHDDVFEDVFKSKNWAERGMTKVIGFTIPAPHRVNVARVAYRT